MNKWRDLLNSDVKKVHDLEFMGVLSKELLHNNNLNQRILNNHDECTENQQLKGAFKQN